MSKKQEDFDFQDPKSKTCSIDSLKRRPVHKPIEEESESESERESDENASVNSEELHSVKYKKTKTEKTKYKQSKLKSQVSELPVIHSSFSFFNYKKFTYCFAVIIIIGGLFLLVNSQKELKRVSTKTLTQIFEDMENRFRSQPDMTLRQIKKQLRKVYNVTQEPPAPAIITLIANRGAESSASDFCLYLGKALASEKYILINNSSYWSGEPDDIKLKIDEEVKSKYQEDEFNVIIIEKLQNIPFKAAMMFHSYCDHENSPFKKAIFLFILHVNKVIPEDTHVKHLDSFAMNSLRKAWISATDDEVDSLITRITGAVVNIK